jgi:threonine aldolase
VQTNIVIFDISAAKLEAQTVSAKLKQRGVLANAISPTHMRMVTHYDVTYEMCETAVGVLREVCTSR